MDYLISEHDGCKSLNAGDSVTTTPLYSCCLIVMRMESGAIYAEHCAGSDLSRLSPLFFSEEAVEALMVTSRASDDQKEQAHALQLRIPYVVLHYYESDRDNASTPIVTVKSDGSLCLKPTETYRLVSY